MHHMLDSLRGPRRRHLLAVSACWVTGSTGWSSFAADVPEAAPAEPAHGAGAAPRPPAALPTIALADLGVELMAVRLTASDFMIDLRYRVKDIAKAQALLEQKVRPVLVNEASGDRFYIPQAPKVGALKQSATSKQPAILDRVYFMLFANPDRKLKAGEKVTLYAGDSVVKGIVVQ
jgi:hypothetical protein